MVVLVACTIFFSFDGEEPGIYGVGDAFLEKGECGYKIIGYIPKSFILTEGDTITLCFEHDAVKAIVVRHTDKRWREFHKVELFESAYPTQLITNSSFVFTSQTTDLKMVRSGSFRLDNGLRRRLEVAVERSAIASYVITRVLPLRLDEQKYLLIMNRKSEIESTAVAPAIAALVSLDNDKLNVIDEIKGMEISIGLVRDLDSDDVVDIVLLHFNPVERSFDKLVFFDRLEKKYRILEDD